MRLLRRGGRYLGRDIGRCCSKCWIQTIPLRGQPLGCATLNDRLKRRSPARRRRRHVGRTTQGTRAKGRGTLRSRLDRRTARPQTGQQITVLSRVHAFRSALRGNTSRFSRPKASRQGTARPLVGPVRGSRWVILGPGSWRPAHHICVMIDWPRSTWSAAAKKGVPFVAAVASYRR